MKLIGLIEQKRAIPLSAIVDRLDDLEGRIQNVPESGGAAEKRPETPGRAALPGAAQVWARLIETVSKTNVTLAAWLREGKPQSLSADRKRLTVIYPKKFTLHQQRLSAEKNKAAVESELAGLLGERGWTVEAFLDSPDAGAQRAGTSSDKELPPKVRIASDLLESRGVTKRGE